MNVSTIILLKRLCRVNIQGYDETERFQNKFSPAAYWKLQNDFGVLTGGVDAAYFAFRLMEEPCYLVYWFAPECLKMNSEDSFTERLNAVGCPATVINR